MSRLKSAKEIPIGGLIDEAGSSRKFKTGDWRSFRPVIDEDKCIHCAMCKCFCPEACIEYKEGKRGDIDFDYCKGCGICESICPVKAIKMKEESEFRK